MNTCAPDTQILVPALEEACRALRGAERAHRVAVARRTGVENADDRVRICRALLHSACVAFVRRVEGKKTQAEQDPMDEWLESARTDEG